MPSKYIVGRVGMFFLTIFLASTLVFFLPRLSGRDPFREKLFEEAQRGGYLEDVDEIAAALNEKYGFDRPLWQQYVVYLSEIARFDLGTSQFTFSKSNNQLLAETLGWTIGLTFVSAMVAFFIGTGMGAIMEWRRQNTGLLAAMAPFLMMSAVPYFIFGLVLLTVFWFSWLQAFDWELFPPYGAYDPTVEEWPNWSDFRFLGSALWHATLPALSIVLVSLGGWAMGMRGMMVTTKGEDYMLQAEAKGLPDNVRFYRYAIRNSLLPQLTGLALQIGLIVSGVVLVEIVFTYPGVGGLLVQSIRNSDYPLIQGIVFVLAFCTAVTTLLLDMIYPMIDPRISYSGN